MRSWVFYYWYFHCQILGTAVLLHKVPIISLWERGTAGAIISFAITVELWDCESTGSLTVGAIA